MAIEAAGLARAISEASFWLYYLSREPDAALSALEADDLKNQIERERELQRAWPNSSELIAQSKLRQKANEEKLGTRSKPSISKIAKSNGPTDGYLRYRIVSAFYGHVSRSSLRHDFLRTHEGHGMNILGPHPAEIPKALYFSAHGMLDCSEAYALIVEDHDALKKLQQVAADLASMRDSIKPSA
jgi:hypothetical protein